MGSDLFSGSKRSNKLVQFGQKNEIGVLKSPTVWASEGFSVETGVAKITHHDHYTPK